MLNEPLPQFTSLQFRIFPDPPHLFPLQVFRSDPLMNIVEMDPNEGLCVDAIFPQPLEGPAENSVGWFVRLRRAEMIKSGSEPVEKLHRRESGCPIPPLRE